MGNVVCSFCPLVTVTLFSSWIKELSLLCLRHIGARPPWSSFFGVMSLGGLWLQCRFCIEEVVLSSILNPLPFLTAVLKCGHPKHDTVRVSSSSNIKLYLSLICPSHSCKPECFSHQTILTTAISLHKTQSWGKWLGDLCSIAASPTSVIGQYVPHWSWQQGKASVQYPLSLAYTPDKHFHSRAEHVCSAAFSKSQRNSSGQSWDKGLLLQGAIRGLA